MFLCVALQIYFIYLLILLTCFFAIMYFQKPLIAITSNAKTDRFAYTTWLPTDQGAFHAVLSVRDGNDPR